MRAFHLCACPPSWENVRNEFHTAVLSNWGARGHERGMTAVCTYTEKDVFSVAGDVRRLSIADRFEVEGIQDRIKAQAGGCFAGLAAGAYACMITQWLSKDAVGLQAALNVAVPLIVYSAECFEAGTTRWQITTGSMIRHALSAVFNPSETLWPQSIPLCYENLNRPRDTLVGFCGRTAPHEVRSAVVGPIESISRDDVVLCTHTSGDSLNLVEPMLLSWRGPASVAVYNGTAEDLVEWSRRLETLGLQQIILSLVSSNVATTATDYDRLYPANVLRQAAVDAAVADMVLVADPAFVPSAGFHTSISAESPLGGSLRAISDSAPTAFVVTSFLTFDDSEMLDLEALRRLLETGSAISFDAYVCPLCRPQAWQWAILEASPPTRFREVKSQDLHHPAWLVKRSVLPHFPHFLHGVVRPNTGAGRIGWTGLPTGLRASTELMRSRGVQLLLLPGYFLHRSKRASVPAGNDNIMPSHFPSIFFNLLLRRSLTSLTDANRTASAARPRMLVHNGLVLEAPPRHTPRLITLQRGSDSTLQLVLVASVILGSSELKRLLSSVPWDVYAVAVGDPDFTYAAKRDLPVVLRNFRPDALVMVLDAYDTILLPCSRSIASEYLSFGRDVVMPSEVTCWPNAALCKSCASRYAADSSERSACELSPNLNSGGYLGRAAALAEAFDWMRQQGDSIGSDDQENAWHYYNTFPSRVALDHRQQIWSTLLFSDLDRFRIENCSVLSGYSNASICIAHGNGASRYDILDPLLRQLEDAGCREKVPPRLVQSYAGLTMMVPMVNAG
eukprot:TRINITY_DN22352_c0_g1_i1.p1 TRINITY_DN22352_c0_g1~~TRINITY_DN22352_c0_g1_i1.p1  ORF type:complete len:813 (+),score=46.22 TRINITY_DN22352_c0_g1_i1:74-2440(+)